MMKTVFYDHFDKHKSFPYILFGKYFLCIHTNGKVLSEWKQLHPVQTIHRTVEGIHYKGGLLVKWRILSTDVSHHQYVGGTSSVWWRVCRMDLWHHHYGGRYAVWICHILNTKESMQYRTTKTAQGIVGGYIYLGKIIFYRQSCYNPEFVLLWLNPDVAEIPLGC